jgi:hypothetical protein
LKGLGDWLRQRERGKEREAKDEFQNCTVTISKMEEFWMKTKFVERTMNLILNKLK